jgi:hypothetical protein
MQQSEYTPITPSLAQICTMNSGWTIWIGTISVVRWKVQIENRANSKLKLSDSDVNILRLLSHEQLIQRVRIKLYGPTIWNVRLVECRAPDLRNIHKNCKFIQILQAKSESVHDKSDSMANFGKCNSQRMRMMIKQQPS